MTPYRAAPTRPEYVCLVCYRSLSIHPGVCQECGVDRLPLADVRVREELRAETGRRLERRMYREYFGLSLMAFVMALPVNLLVGGLIGRVVWIACALAVANLNTRLYALGRPRSALAVFAERRRRIERELGPTGEAVRRALPDKNALALITTAPDDPDTLDLEHLLTWLGARVEP
jgi:hypothetical protein